MAEIQECTGRFNKACLPCRTRKVKCDAFLVGIPCSSCTSRQRIDDCVLRTRKPRTSKATHDSPSSKRESLDDDGSPRVESDLLYLNILNDAVKGSVGSSTNAGSTPCLGQEVNSASRIKLPRLHDTDYEYLVKRGVFELPPLSQLDTFVKTYFDHVYPFVSVLSRGDFMRGYRAGDYSLFLLHTMLTTASIYMPTEVLSACGFANRSDAQQSFFYRAKLLHDIVIEDNPLSRLQGYIVLCMVILDHPTEWDFSYWYHNAIRIATKIDLRGTCIREDKPRKVVKIYRRLWWILYSLDIFQVSLNSRSSRLLEDTSQIKPRTEDDRDDDEEVFDLLSPLKPQQLAMPVIQLELSQIIARCLSTATSKTAQDPRQMLQPLDAWRSSLPQKLKVEENCATDVYYLNVQALSYRLECVLCRRVRHRWRQSSHSDWVDWAKERLRSAVLQLDAIAMRVFASGTLHEFPVAFITTMTVLVALHIETALDPTETEITRSMAQISISQTMLFLNQGRDIPSLKRALPIFEEILLKKDINVLSQSHDRSQQPLQSYEGMLPLDQSFLDFDFLEEWQIGDFDLPVE